ncbi:MAG: COG4315 family predicted lipoprotein [Dehalococcoidia bacterium]
MSSRISRSWRRAGGILLGVVTGALMLSAAGGRASAQAAATIQTRDAGALGTILTAANGKSLYMFDRDTAGVSNCNGACAGTWPALELATGTPVAPSGVGGKLAVITRTDGKRQVTYNDRPLYFYAADTAAGDTKRDGVGGVWHDAKPVVATTSAPAAAPAAAAPAAAAAPSAAQAAGPSGLPRAGSGGQIGAGNAHGKLIEILALAAIVVSLGIGLLHRSSRANTGER